MASIKRPGANTLQQSVIDALAVQTAEITHHLDRWFEQTTRRLAAIEARLDVLSSQAGELDVPPLVVDTAGKPLN